MTPRFQLGTIVATPGALQVLDTTNTPPFVLRNRHVCGGWGVEPRENEVALHHDFRFISSDALSSEEEVWIISVT